MVLGTATNQLPGSVSAQQASHHSSLPISIRSSLTPTISVSTEPPTLASVLGARLHADGSYEYTTLGGRVLTLFPPKHSHLAPSKDIRNCSEKEQQETFDDDDDELSRDKGGEGVSPSGNFNLLIYTLPGVSTS